MFDAIWHRFCDLPYQRELGSYRRLTLFDARGHQRKAPDYCVIHDIDVDDEEFSERASEQLRQVERRKVEFESPTDPYTYVRMRIDSDPNHWAVERVTASSDVGNLTTFHLVRQRRKRIYPQGAEA